MFLSDLSIKQPVLATMLAVSLVTLGVFSYRELAIDQFPDVELPVLTVQTLYPGASPETVEREVTKRIEEALNTISGVRHIASTTTEGLSAIVVEFRLGIAHQQRPAGRAGQDQRHPRRLPEGHEGAGDPAHRLQRHADRLDRGRKPDRRHQDALLARREDRSRSAFETVSGVGQVNLVGLARREIQVLLDRDKLKSYGLTYAAGRRRRCSARTWTCPPANSSRAGRSRWCAWPASSARSRPSTT